MIPLAAAAAMQQAVDDTARRNSELQPWERDSFTRRLLLARAGSHCKGCGAPLTLTNEGACEYCGLKPR